MNTIDQERCQNCLLCSRVCPCHVLGVNEQREVYVIPEREAICQECGQCMAVCKTGAITVSGLSHTSDLKKLPETSWQLPDFMDFISGRRSVRNFRDKAVADELIHSLLESISYAPFGAAPEKMCITVVNSRERIAQALPHMEEFLDQIVSWMENPLTRHLIKRKKTPETFHTIRHHVYPISKLGNYKLKYGDRITRNAPALILFHAAEEAEEHTHNSLIYATYAMLAAHALGLGAAMNSIVPAAINKHPKVRELFDIPRTHEVSISLILGHPGISYHKTLSRRKHSIRVLS